MSGRRPEIEAIMESRADERPPSGTYHDDNRRIEAWLNGTGPKPTDLDLRLFGSAR